MLSRGIESSVVVRRHYFVVVNENLVVFVSLVVVFVNVVVVKEVSVVVEERLVHFSFHLPLVAKGGNGRGTQ